MKNSFHSDNFICLINATSQALTFSNNLTQSPSALQSRLFRKMHHIGCICLIFCVPPIGSVSPTIAEFTENRSKGSALSTKFRSLPICMSVCWRVALQLKMYTDRMWQQKKKIRHKLCIDMERSEYTSFSMLTILKCEFQMTSILILRYMDSRGWGKAGRHSVAVSSFSVSAVRSICLSITAVSVQ